MLSKDLKIINLNITEDYYDYKGLFILRGGEKELDVDLANVEKQSMIQQIKTYFDLDDDIEKIRKTIMDKLMEASKIEARIIEGKHYNEDLKNNKTERAISSLDMS